MKFQCAKILRVALLNAIFIATLSIHSQAQSATALVTQPSPTPTPNASKPPAAAAPVKIGSLTLTGSIRARAESWDWFETEKADPTYTFGAVQIRLGIGQTKESYEWLVEGEAPILIGLPNNAVAPAPQGQLGLGGTYFAANGTKNATAILKQGFIRFKGVAGDKASSLKLGRFEFIDGMEVLPADATLATIKRDHISQRLIGTFGFTHVGRSFDGVQFGRNFKAGNYTFFGARPTEGVFQLDGNRQLDVDIWYTAFTKPIKKKTSESELRAFATYYHDGRQVLKTDSRAAALRTADRENIRVTTIGAHHIGVYKAGGAKFDTLVWGAGQFGSWGLLDQRSGAIAVEAGVQPTKALQSLKPWLRAGYFRSTGDGNATDGKHTTFFQMLPTPRIYARTPYYNAMNNEDAFVQLRLKPHAKVGLRTDLRHLRLSNRNDLWYVGGGAFQKNTFGFVGRATSGNKSLGWFFDTSADFTVNARTSFTLYYGGMRGGNVQAAIYPLGGNRPGGQFFYVELLQKF